MILGIYGSSGLGREVLEIAKRINKIENRWSEYIFIDDVNPKGKKNNIEMMPLLDISKYHDISKVEIVIASGEPEFRSIMWEKSREMKIQPATFIHPSVHIPESASIGKGVTIFPNVYVACNTIIAENVILEPFVSIGEDTTIDSHSVISPFCFIGGKCSIGRQTYIGPSVPVRDRTIIGSYSIIGMGSVVLRDIPDEVIAIGNPARAMKKNEDHRVFK